MLITPPNNLCGYDVNGWGVEFSDWKGFFSTDKEGGVNVEYIINNKYTARDVFTLNANVKLPNLSVELEYIETRNSSIIKRSVRLKVLEDGILGDLVLRLRLAGFRSPKILHAGRKIENEIKFDRNYFLKPDYSTEIKSDHGLKIKVSDQTKEYTNLKLHRYVRIEGDGVRLHSRLIGDEFYMHSFDPYFLIPFKFKVKQLPLLSDKNILVRERFRENFLQKRWQKVPALHVAKHDVYELNQEILLNDL